MAKKRVVLPLGNKKIYEELAKIALDVEGSVKNPSKFINDVMDELAKEAFLYSFTPSGEIGDNPQTPRVADTFYKAFGEEFDPVKGDIAVTMKKRKHSAVKVGNTLLRVKASIINLVQLYLEVSSFDLKTHGGESNSSFEYPALSKKRTDEDYEKLVAVEKNRYTRLFIASLFTKEILKMLTLDEASVTKFIENTDLRGDQKHKSNPKEQFKFLRNPDTRLKFIEKIKNDFDATYNSEKGKTRSSPKGQTEFKV